jgi:hypothetical protein
VEGERNVDKLMKIFEGKEEAQREKLSFELVQQPAAASLPLSKHNLSSMPKI